MSERLTADELVEIAQLLASGHPEGIETRELRLLLAAAEDAQRLRAAIEKHEIDTKTGWPRPEIANRELWEALK